MSRHNALGKEGEDRAAAFLTAAGFTILERNYRSGRAEVDIIARKEQLVIFVEVKTRSNYKFGFPEESVSAGKQKRMAMAASQYLFDNGIDAEIRFDVLALLKSPKGDFEITYFEDAFFIYE